MSQRNSNLHGILVAFLLLGCTNWLQLQAAEIECLKCDSSADANCITDLTKITTEKCQSDKGCFTLTETATGKVTRGCITEQTCNNDSNCRKCSSTKCNDYNICKTCDSTSTSQCAQTDSSGVSNEVCENKSVQCMIDATKGNTLRRCATTEDLKSCASNSATCRLCTGPNCNVGIFPSNRIQCYECDSTNEKCSNVITNTDILSLPCLLYKADDACYTFASNATHVQRGCISDVGDSNKCKQPTANSACAACTTGKCNSLPYEREQALKCVRCDSSQQKDCMWAQLANTATACTNKVPYTKSDTCYSRTKDGTVTRGCLYDLEETVQSTCTSKDDKTCDICGDSDGCNNRDRAEFNCIHCRSDITPECRNEIKLSGGTCRNSVFQTNAECFTGIWNGIVIRGCMVDTDEQMAYVCNDTNNKKCKKCAEANCNFAKWNGAGLLALSKALLITVIVALWRLR